MKSSVASLSPLSTRNLPRDPRTCPAGNIAYVDPNTQMPILCNEALRNSCPNGYTCTFNALINSHVCCGATDHGVCPEQEKAFISTADMSPRECIVNMEASCPANYLCHFSMQRNKYYCCTSVTGRTCPAGKFLHQDAHTAVPTRCTIGRGDQCPDGYSCQSYLRNASQGFCCTSNAVCPDDAEFYVDEQSQLPRACTMGSFVSCPHGYHCRSLTSTAEGFCCRSSLSVPVAAADGCPPGNFVFLSDGGDVSTCDPFNPPNAPCPEGSTCQWSTANQRYQCCGSNPVTPPVRSNDGCLDAQIAYRDNKVVRVCTAGSSTCPPGFFCQFSSLNRQFQCCGVSGGCPADSVAFVGLSGTPEKCIVGKSKCPPGFACRRSVAGHHICCASEGKKCAADQVSVDGLCLPLSAAGRACQHSEQCAGGSVCDSGLCRCPPFTLSIGGICQAETKCAPEQVKFDSTCHNRVELGQSCEISKQCPDESSCVNAVCGCNEKLVNLNGKCTPVSVHAKIAQSKASNTRCANGFAKALVLKETGRAVLCSPKVKKCPRGYSCQINSKRSQYICCSGDDDPQVCPTGRVPYLLNGTPQRCTTQRCPRGYECAYKNHDYLCCSSVSTVTSSPHPSLWAIREGEQCTLGAPLVYPSTRLPIVCTPAKKGCPAGFTCQQSRSSEQFICCPFRFRMGVHPGAPPCGGLLVLVSRLTDGRVEERCERSCPYSQVPIGGICYELGSS